MEDYDVIPVRERSVIYAYTGSNRDIIPYQVNFDDDLYPGIYTYNIKFDYKISGKYSKAEFVLYVTTRINNNSSFEDNGYLASFGTKLLTIDLKGNEGNVDVNMNDEDFGFWMPDSSYDAGFVYYRDKGFGYRKSNSNFIPIVYVVDSVGNRYTLNHLDYNTSYPETEEGLSTLSGYLQNFTIVGKKKSEDVLV